MFSGEAKDVEAAKRGDIIFYREPDLPPGVYTMESIVLDVLSPARQRACRHADHSCRPTRRRLGMSSLVLVSRVEESARRRARVRRRPPRSTSAARSSIRTSASRCGDRRPRELPFYFALYGPRGGVKAQAELAAERRERWPKRRSSFRHRSARACSTSAGCRSVRCRTAPTSSADQRDERGQRTVSRTAFFTVGRLSA